MVSFGLEDMLDLLNLCGKGPRELHLMTLHACQLPLLDPDQILDRIGATAVRQLGLSMRIGTPGEVEIYLRQFGPVKLYHGGLSPAAFRLRLVLPQPGNMDIRAFVLAASRVPQLIELLLPGISYRSVSVETQDTYGKYRPWFWGGGPLQDALRSLREWRARKPTRNDPGTWNEWREKYGVSPTWTDDDEDHEWDEPVDGTDELEVEDEGDDEESSVSTRESDQESSE
ncbi:hypothetical protein EHS25_007896 [Saitozyma podzolica]|jgi:hypothetical protein|uniref:Uncharacterized protein n=1 Tax=Saitozyma podzolica TaxID=1890683 RepID=A0A427YR04_9TREE|nr:hypothetical protein EHS25_007896 [Saitozyma podzolica]